jgi:hypothetical protein
MAEQCRTRRRMPVATSQTSHLFRRFPHSLRKQKGKERQKYMSTNTRLQALLALCCPLRNALTRRWGGRERGESRWTQSFPIAWKSPANWPISRQHISGGEGRRSVPCLSGCRCRDREVVYPGQRQRESTDLVGQKRLGWENI